MKHSTKTLTFVALVLFAGPSVAFWFCPPMSSGQTEKNYSSVPQRAYPIDFRSMTTSAQPPIYTVGFNESKSTMPSPLEPSAPPGMGPPRSYPQTPMGPAPDVRIERGGDANNYYLTIYLTGYQPEDIGVRIDRGSLAIYNVRSDERRHQAEGFYQQMTSFRQFSRRISLPHDADPSRMSRTNGIGTVEVVIPRIR